MKSEVEGDEFTVFEVLAVRGVGHHRRLAPMLSLPEVLGGGEDPQHHVVADDPNSMF